MMSRRRIGSRHSRPCKNYPLPVKHLRSALTGAGLGSGGGIAQPPRRRPAQAHVSGTVTDVNTRLVWEKLSNDGTIHDKDNLYTWTNAFAGHLATLNGTSFAGHADWRLPNVRELQSIANYQNALPAVSPAFNNNCSSSCSPTTCSCTFDGDYWSSTSSVSGPSNAWFAGFHYANV